MRNLDECFQLGLVWGLIAEVQLPDCGFARLISEYIIEP